MFIVGLTGGIGSGKTAASDFFQTKKITIVDADICARLVVQKGQPALEKITQRFGSGILLPSGELNRPKLRKTVFASPADKQWLEALLHPLIAQTINDQLDAASSAYTIFSSPLLLETEQHKRCQRVLLIDVPVELQIERTLKRDASDQTTIENIIKSQMSREDKQKDADDIVDNSTDLASLHAQLLDLHNQYLRLAKTHDAQ